MADLKRTHFRVLRLNMCLWGPSGVHCFHGYRTVLRSLPCTYMATERIQVHRKEARLKLLPVLSRQSYHEAPREKKDCPTN